ncbi:MAG: hypothetical protein AB1503_07255 [Bacillota bacterium]
MRRFSRWAATLLAVGLAGGVLVWWFWPRAEYVFLVVDEANGSPPADWSGTELAPVAWYDGEGSLHVPRGAVRPWHRVVCLHEVDAAGVRVASRILTAGSLPARIPLGRAVPGLETDRRALAGPLEVLRPAAGGNLRLRYGGEEKSLAPGESWAQLRINGPQGQQIISVENPDGWKEAVQEALARGYPVTRLVVTYHGMWPRSRIRPIGQASPENGLPWAVMSATVGSGITEMPPGRCA